METIDDYRSIRVDEKFFFVEQRGRDANPQRIFYEIRKCMRPKRSIRYRYEKCIHRKVEKGRGEKEKEKKIRRSFT